MKKKSSSGIKSEYISRKWNISVEKSKCDLKDSFSRVKVHIVVATRIILITASGFFTALLVRNKSAHSPFLILLRGGTVICSPETFFCMAICSAILATTSL